jgi:RNA polymerase sigma-70 factor (family 1)
LKGLLPITTNCKTLPDSLPYIEPEILALIAGGDDYSFSLLYARYYPKVYGIAFKILKSSSHAEDVLQDVFIKIWNNRTRLNEVNDFNAYLNTVTRNHIFNQLRKKAHEAFYIKEQSSTNSFSSNQTINDVLYHELDKSLLEAVSKLPPQQKKIFQLSRMHGLKQEEIADSLNISLGTVKKHMMVSLRFIRNYISSVHHLWLFLMIFLKNF